MNDRELETRLRVRYRERAGETDTTPLPLRGDVAAIPQTATVPRRRFGQGRGMTLLAAAALLLVGGALAGSGLLRLPSVVPPLPAPSLGVVATASPDATSTVRPSLGPPPSDPIGPLAWTQARLEEDWPAPVREEPAGGATVLQIRHRDLTPHAASDEEHTFESDQYRDPTGDTGSDVYPWADIRWVEFCDEDGLAVGRVSLRPAGVDPRQLWIAYGVVVDIDGDGVPDWRYGIDNVPLDNEDHRWGRSWRTDLHTGRTESAVGLHITLGDSGLVFSPGCEGRGMSFGAEVAGRGRVGNGLPERFYAWASVIADGRVVATDYAPDVGWLERSPDAKTLPKPGGTYVLQDPFPVHLSMTVPDGWIDHGGPELTRDWLRPPQDELEFVRGTTRIQFEVFDNPEVPCPDDRTPLGPSFDDLVSYLEALPNIDLSETRNETLDGYRAVYLKAKAHNGFDLECGENYESAWIVDVDGVRMVIWATYESAPAETERSEVRQIVESIQIDGVSPSYSPPASPDPTPRPTPRPTPLPPADGPVPPNARTWTVTVDNQSSKPAALFVIGDEDELALVGSATPNVVPAGTTVQVTFRFPADEDGWIYVNPRPGEGGSLVNADQIGIPGKIWIRADGQVGWASP